MKKPLFFIISMILPIWAAAQFKQINGAEIAEGIKKLSVNGSVLYIAAHPDDENTRLLAYLAKERKLRTGYLSLTRGDGGQNLIGNEQGELLGLIRTQELLAARRIDGAEQFFTRANDFGFSKTADETLKLWNHEQILGDVVWVIRKFRPDVIITRFPPDARAGHGHHASSAILAHEAFKAAADPSQYPEQLKWVKPWQAKRLFWNTYNFGTNNTTSLTQLQINVGGFNAPLGKSYGEIASISRTSHKSQGFGTGLQRGNITEYFSFTAGTPVTKDLFEGIDLTLKNKQAASLIKTIQDNFNIYQPANSLPHLLKLKKMELAENQSDLLNQLILACAGFWAEINVNQNIFAVGDSVMGKLQAIYRTAENLQVKLGLLELNPNQLLDVDFSLTAQKSMLTQPYWLSKPHTPFLYAIDNQQDIGLAQNKPMALHQTVEINGVAVPVEIPIVYKTVHPVMGEMYEPVVIAPKATATLSSSSYIFTNGMPQQIAVKVRGIAQSTTGNLDVTVPGGWAATPDKIDFSVKKGEEKIYYFMLKPNPKSSSGKLEIQLSFGAESSNLGLRKIEYDHIPTITYFPVATASLANIDLKTDGKKIAYINGAGDLVADALVQVGYQVSRLSAAQISTTDLSVFDAVVTGVRLFNVDGEIQSAMPKLMEYVKNGGVLVEQYNVSRDLKSTSFGPYPFKLVNKRVTEEDARVTIVNPADAVLNYPNKIDEKDFEGWVQERGIYFAADVDKAYRTPLQMGDTNEEQHNGSLLVADYGKGKFVYTSLVFYRELPAGVPGAFRLFANLLANPKNIQHGAR